MSIWTILIIGLGFYYFFIGPKKKRRIAQQQDRGPDPAAEEAATQFLNAFRGGASVAELDRQAEELIELAGMYWEKYDMASYRKLLAAAEETSYMYNGSRYPRKLLEDLIRENHSHV